VEAAQARSPGLEKVSAKNSRRKGTSSSRNDDRTACRHYEEQRITKVEIAARMQSSCVQSIVCSIPKNSSATLETLMGAAKAVQPQAMP